MRGLGPHSLDSHPVPSSYKLCDLSTLLKISGSAELLQASLAGKSASLE